MVKIQIPQHHDHHTLTREVGAKGDGNRESHWGTELGGRAGRRLKPPSFGNLFSTILGIF